jgi:hypothetical protein
MPNVLRECAIIAVTFCWLNNSAHCAAEAIGHSKGTEAAMASRPTRMIELSNGGRSGKTIGQVYDVTGQWVREFFKSPEQQLEGLLGIKSSCLADESCLAFADESLRKNKSDWRKSSDQGKILVGLTYVLGEYILHQRPELDWVVLIEGGFVDEIGIGNGEAVLGLFSELTRPDKTFVLDDVGIDLVTWGRLLASRPLSKIEQKNPTMNFIIRE